MMISRASRDTLSLSQQTRFSLPSRLASLLLIVSAVTVSAQAQIPRCELLPLPSTEKRLDNGLRVVIVPADFPGVISLQVVVQAGLRNETQSGMAGMAHLFEHLTYRGTERYPEKTYSDTVARASARQSAHTTDDFTTYQSTFASGDLETFLAMEADRLQNLVFSRADLSNLAGAIAAEQARATAPPMTKLFEAIRASAFSVHPYGRSMFGSRQDIEQLGARYDEARSFFERRYRPEHTTLVMVGDVDPARAMNLIEKYWNGWPRGSDESVPPTEPPLRGPRYTGIVMPGGSQTLISVSFRTPPFSPTSKEFAALELLLESSFGARSDLRRRLVDESESVDLFGADIGSNLDPSLATIYARVNDPRDVLKIRDSILRTIADARRVALPESELEELKSNTRYRYATALADVDALAGAVARFARFGEGVATINALSCLRASVTAADITATAQKYLTDRNLIVATVSRSAIPNMEPVPAIDSLAAGQPKAGAVRLVVNRSALPQLNLKLTFNVGSAHDPNGKEGLAALAAAMIRAGGSRSRSADDFDAQLYPFGATFNARVDREMTTFTTQVHRDHGEEILGALSNALLRPALRRDDFRRLRDAQMDALRAILSNSDEVARERLQQRTHHAGPYDHPSLGTVAGIKAITLADIRAFIEKHYTTGNLLAAFAGDVPDSMPQLLKTELSKLPDGITPAPLVTPRPPNGFMVEIIQSPSARGTTIAIGHPIDVTRSHPDFAALSVATTWFGAHRSILSRLTERIANVRGMNRGNNAYIEAFPDAAVRAYPEPNIARHYQMFDIYIPAVSNANAHMALRVAVHELRSMIQNGLDEQSFEASRRYLLKSLEFRGTNQDLYNGDTIDERWFETTTAQLRERVARLRLDDVNRAVKKHLSSEDLYVIFVTADAVKLRSSLSSDTASAVHDESGKRTALMEEDKKIQALLLKIESEDIRVYKLEDIFAQ